MSRAKKVITRRVAPAPSPPSPPELKLEDFPSVEEYYSAVSLRHALPGAPLTALGWDDPRFDEARRKMADSFDRLTETAVLVESGIKCRCGSTRTFSVQSQTRSADEGGTNFVVCGECRRRWTVT